MITTVRSIHTAASANFTCCGFMNQAYERSWRTRCSIRHTVATAPVPFGTSWQLSSDVPSAVGRVMLHEFIAINREEIIRRCRAKVAMRSIPPPTDMEIDHGVPVFLDQLVSALRLGLTSSTEIGRSAVQHGHDLLLQGFTVSQVVHDYGDV